jgi:fatty-acyl-CoA synthase
MNVDADSYRDWLAPYRDAALPDGTPDPSAILLLMFSSGTTGAPKAVICTQGRFAMLAQSLAIRTELVRESVTYLCMPLFHGNAMMLNFAPATYVGASICLARRFSASGFVRDLHRHRFTYVNYVGRALSYVLAVPPDPRDQASSLQLALGTEASATDIERFSARFGCRVSEGYGMSEGVLRINRTPDTPRDSIGVPVGDVDVRIMNEQTSAECPRAVLDAHGRLLNPDVAIGQLVAVGKASTFEGYYNNPEAQAERVRGQDFWTGDLAYRDEAGYFYFAGRTSDWLRVDGENFAAAPVERIINRWHKAAVSLVYAVPDPRTGDQVMCALQMASGERFDPDEFASFLDEQPDLGTKWRPSFVRVMDEVPTTGTNKVAKASLRRETWQTDDPVYWQPDAGVGYRLLDNRQRAEFVQEFAAHGRTAHLPSYESTNGVQTHHDHAPFVPP